MSWRRLVSEGWETRRTLERQIREEMQEHFDALLRDLQRAGLTEPQARSEAPRRFGDFDTHYQHGRQVRARRLAGSLRAERLRGIGHDVQSAYRSLRARPAFALTAIGMLGVGVGATTLVFSLIAAVLLQPLPYEDPEQLVLIDGAQLTTADYRTMTRADVLNWRPLVRRSFADVAAYYPGSYSVNLTGLGEPTEGGVSEVTHNFFAVLGQEMTLGRYFIDADAEADGPPPAVIGERLWRSHWNADPEILGEELLVKGFVHRIVGVIPARAQLPEDVDVWVPMAIKIDDFIVWGARYFRYIGRLRSEIGPEVAAIDLRELKAAFQEARPNSTPEDMTLEALHEVVVGRARSPLWLLFGGVTLLLLIALANLASYLLVRSRSREREYAVRAALGAGRRRLLQQSFAESLIVSAAGMLLAVGFASWSLGLLRGSSYLPLPRLEALLVDWRLFLFAAGASAACAVGFGLLPAWLASRPNILGALKLGRTADRGSGRRPREVLVVVQVALAVVLAAGAGLLVRSYGRLLDIDNGFAGDGLTFAMNLEESAFPAREDAEAFVAELRRRALAIPGVRAAGAVNLVPLADQGAIGLRYNIEGEAPDDERRFATRLVATPGYLDAIGTEVLAGRPLDESDTADSAAVAIVSEEFVRRYLGSPDAAAGVGKRVLSPFDESPIEIVGVVADVRRSGPGEEVQPEIYRPLTQGGGRPGFFAVRAGAELGAVASEVRTIVAELAPELPIFDMQLMSERLGGRLAQPRLLAMLFAGFAVGSVLLAAFGIYAVVAFWVTTRTREIGVRLALGATRRRVFRELMRAGTIRLVAGLVAGVGAYLAFARLLDTTLLFGTGVYDPTVLVGVVLVVALATVAGVAGAASRATRLDPLIALRSE